MWVAAHPEAGKAAGVKQAGCLGYGRGEVRPRRLVVGVVDLDVGRVPIPPAAALDVLREAGGAGHPSGEVCLRAPAGVVGRVEVGAVCLVEEDGCGARFLVFAGEGSLVGVEGVLGAWEVAVGVVGVKVIAEKHDRIGLQVDKVLEERVLQGCFLSDAGVRKGILGVCKGRGGFGFRRHPAYGSRIIHVVARAEADAERVGGGRGAWSRVGIHTSRRLVPRVVRDLQLRRRPPVSDGAGLRRRGRHRGEAGREPGGEREHRDRKTLGSDGAVYDLVQNLSC